MRVFAGEDKAADAFWEKFDSIMDKLAKEGIVPYGGDLKGSVVTYLPGVDDPVPLGEAAKSDYFYLSMIATISFLSLTFSLEEEFLINRNS